MLSALTELGLENFFLLLRSISSKADLLSLIPSLSLFLSLSLSLDLYFLKITKHQQGVDSFDGMCENKSPWTSSTQAREFSALVFFFVFCCQWTFRRKCDEVFRCCRCRRFRIISSSFCGCIVRHQLPKSIDPQKLFFIFRLCKWVSINECRRRHNARLSELNLRFDFCFRRSINQKFKQLVLTWKFLA